MPSSNIKAITAWGSDVGIQSGSLSLSRFRLLGGPRRPKLAVLNERLEPYKCGPVKISGILKEEMTGWVRPVGLDNLDLPPESHWDLTDCRTDDGFLLRMRIEIRKVPSQLLAMMCKLTYYETEKARGKRPSPKERKDLKEKITRDLLSKALPAISYLDGYWRERAGELWVFTSSKKGQERFRNLFQSTFADHLGMTVIKVDPPLMGLSAGEWQDSSVANETLSRLSLTTPVNFAESK